MKLINREGLKEKLDRGDDFKLVMALGEWAYRAKHIPGSLHFNAIEEALEALDPNDDIVVYCSNVRCLASVAAYRHLSDRGYKHVRRYAGGSKTGRRLATLGRASLWSDRNTLPRRRHSSSGESGFLRSSP